MLKMSFVIGKTKHGFRNNNMTVDFSTIKKFHLKLLPLRKL